MPEAETNRTEAVKPKRESDNFAVFNTVQLGLFDSKHDDEKTLAIFESLLERGFVPVYMTVSADYPTSLYCRKADLISAPNDHAKTIPCGDTP